MITDYLTELDQLTPTFPPTRRRRIITKKK